MKTEGQRRARLPRCASVALCIALAVSNRSAFGFRVTVPGSTSRRRAPATSSLPLGKTHQARPRATVGAAIGREGRRRLQQRAGALLSEREDGGDGAEQDQTVDGAAGAPVAAASPTAPPITTARSRRYVGDGAGMADDGGVGGPKGDGRGKEWTEDLCSKRLSLLHRKLRQVKSLQAQQAREPDSLDDAQRLKLGRKQDLVTEISELEALRRDLRKREWESGGDDGGATSDSPRKEKPSRLPPGPFAAANAGVGHLQQDQHDDARGPRGREEEEDDGAQYTSDGLRLASPKRMVQPPRPAAPAAPSLAPAASAPAASVEREEPRLTAADLRLSPSEQASSGPAVERREGVGWGALGSGEAVEAGGQGEAGAMADAPAGGYPKRLAGLMSFCRVSDKATCEILVEMGRVTVNGEKATDPGIKVDLMTDIIVANGVAVTFPGKIDNSDETRVPREDVGKRTGPIPKSEKNTWKQKTKYRWNMDDGLLAKKTRRAANAKAFDKKRRTGGGGGYDDW